MTVLLYLRLLTAQEAIFYDMCNIMTSIEMLEAFWPQTASKFIGRSQKIIFQFLLLILSLFYQKRVDWYSFRYLLLLIQLGNFFANFVYN